jgi:hypothetical protein
MQYAILAACRRPGFVFCAGWYRRTFRVKKAQGLPDRSVYEMQAGTCRQPRTVNLHLAQAKCRLFPDLDRPTIYREYGLQDGQA